jgi:predicted NAD/FAD-binding protein
MLTHIEPRRPLEIAVIGTGISGMAAAWLLSDRHRVTVYEREDRLGGHSNTVEVDGSHGPVPIDTGFIVYNEPNYPNLTALLRLLEVPTQPSEMSFGVSLDGGRVEYAGTSLATLFAQKRNLLRPGHWAMLRDLIRFYREAPELLRAGADADELTLAAYLERHSYSRAFIDEHLLPMAAAIWSAPPCAMGAYPAASFVRFCDNHGLIRLRDRPQWRTVTGGSREYVRRLTERYADRIRLSRAVRRVSRHADQVLLEDERGGTSAFDAVVIATHADEALALLGDPSASERSLLGAFRYERNAVVLHSDPALMPRRRAVWSSWNYLGRRRRDAELSVTYWLNRLQSLPGDRQYFVTLNGAAPREGTVLRRLAYEHPVYDTAATLAQRNLWRLQGQRNTWFCGAYFGAGFHEDGLQAGLAVAEGLGVRRPWTVPNESGRIHLGPASEPAHVAAAA